MLPSWRDLPRQNFKQGVFLTHPPRKVQSMELVPPKAQMLAQFREGVQMKNFLNGHCPERAPPPPMGNVGPFFGRQILIENDNENDDDNGDNFDAWWWQCPKIFNSYDFVVKIYPF